MSLNLIFSAVTWKDYLPGNRISNFQTLLAVSVSGEAMKLGKKPRWKGKSSFKYIRQSIYRQIVILSYPRVSHHDNPRDHIPHNPFKKHELVEPPEGDPEHEFHIRDVIDDYLLERFYDDLD